MTTKETQTPGPWSEFLPRQGNPTCDWAVGNNGGETVAQKILPCDARLIAAACNSYDRHCGPRAVECAEADLLGDLLAACEHTREALSVRADYWQNDPEEYSYLLDTLDIVTAAIARAKGQ